MKRSDPVPARLTRQSSLGKILQDTHTVASSGIEEKGFIVCMTQKVCSYAERQYWKTDDS